MANYTLPYGPFWPLGRLTVATPGVPVPMTQNLNAIGLTYTQGGTAQYAASFNQLWLRAAVGNTGNTYLVVQGGSKSDTNSIVIFLAPGEFIYIGDSANNRNTFGFNDFLVDADTAGNYLQATGVVA